MSFAANGGSAAGRTTVRSQWEVTPTLVPFDGRALGLGARHDTGAPVAGTGSSVALNDVALGRGQGSVHHWRLRTTSRSPYFPHTPWFSPATTTPTETHVRTGGTITGVEDTPSPLVARIESSRPIDHKSSKRVLGDDGMQLFDSCFFKMLG